MTVAMIGPVAITPGAIQFAVIRSLGIVVGVKATGDVKVKRDHYRWRHRMATLLEGMADANTDRQEHICGHAPALFMPDTTSITWSAS